jgi:DNA-binding transcriptional MerR regulator
MDEQLAISELARRAGVSIRTIRYYIGEGLLPPPQSNGRYAQYPQEFLIRLELIRKLRDAFLPLKEIRILITDLDESQIQVLLAGGMVTEKKNIADAPPTYNSDTGNPQAVEYINQILKTHLSPPDAVQPIPTISDRIALKQAVFSLQALKPSIGREERWLRIEIAPGVELSLRHPLKPDIEQNLERLIAQVRLLFIR